MHVCTILIIKKLICNTVSEIMIGAELFKKRLCDMKIGESLKITEPEVAGPLPRTITLRR